MTTKNHVPLEIVTAAATMLSPYISGLSPGALIRALESYNPGATPEKNAPPPKKPMTRKEAAKELGVSVQSVDRYVSSGRLVRVQYSPRAIRISAESVYNLMKGGEL